jgi:hypothetical protein
MITTSLDRSAFERSSSSTNCEPIPAWSRKMANSAAHSSASSKTISTSQYCLKLICQHDVRAIQTNRIYSEGMLITKGSIPIVIINI